MDTPPKRKHYMLRHNNPALWDRFKAGADEAGIPMRTLILLLIEAFLDGKIAVNMIRRR